MRKFPTMTKLAAAFLAGTLVQVANPAAAQEAAGAAPVPGQEGLDSAFFWFGITVVAMVIALYAVHRSVYRAR